jgi:hypothetical protein
MTPEPAPGAWDHPERSIGARFDRAVRPVAPLLSFLGACFATPGIPELHFQPLLILLVEIGLIIVAVEMPTRDLAFTVTALMVPNLWASGCAARLARAIPVPDERERAVWRRARETGLVTALGVCVCAAFEALVAIALAESAGRASFTNVRSSFSLGLSTCCPSPSVCRACS